VTADMDLTVRLRAATTERVRATPSSTSLLCDEAALEIALLRRVVQYLHDQIDFRPTGTIWQSGSPIAQVYGRALHSSSKAAS
jgi:hypothetical protein